MYDDYATMLEGYDNVEASSGMSNEPLEAGWYALTVASVQEKTTTKNGVPQVRLQLRVTEGPAKGRSAFVRLYLGASKLTRREGNEVTRTAEEYEKARASVQGQMKGFMKAIGLTTGAPVGEGADKIFNFYGVDGWEGREFVGRITLKPGSVNETTGREYGPENNLAEYFPTDDPKKGLGWLRAKGNITPILATVRV